MDYKSKLIIELANHVKHRIKNLYITGSIRRKENKINDIDFITKKKLRDIYILMRYYYGGQITINRAGDNYSSIHFKSAELDCDIDFWHANDDYEYRFLKWMRDMKKGENIYYRKLAKEAGYILSDRGLRKDGIWIDINSKAKLRQLIKNNNNNITI